MIGCLSRDLLEMMFAAIHCVNDWNASGRYIGVVILANSNKYRFDALQKMVSMVDGHFAGRWDVVGCLSRTSGPFTLDGDMTVNQWHCTDIRSHMRKDGAESRAGALEKSKPLAAPCSIRDSVIHRDRDGDRNGDRNGGVKTVNESRQGTNTVEGTEGLVTPFADADLRLRRRNATGGSVGPPA